jgi:hypothetical protein
LLLISIVTAFNFCLEYLKLLNNFPPYWTDMDPLSITAASVSLLSGITTLSKTISSFVIVAREARKDVDGFSRELVSLSLCVEALRDDGFDFPESLRAQLVTILSNCDAVTREMTTLVQRYTHPSAGRRIKWSFSSRDEVVKLRNRLEAHKSALEIALECANLAMNVAIKDDTTAIRAELATLKIQVLQLQPSTAGPNFLVQRFLDETLTYTESVINPFEQGTITPDSEHTISEQSVEANQSPLDTKILTVPVASVITSASSISDSGVVDGATVTQDHLLPEHQTPTPIMESPERQTEEGDLQVLCEEPPPARDAYWPQTKSANSNVAVEPLPLPERPSPPFSNIRQPLEIGPDMNISSSLEPHPEKKPRVFVTRRRPLKPILVDAKKVAALKTARKALDIGLRKDLDNRLKEAEDHYLIERLLLQGARLMDEYIGAADLHRFGRANTILAMQYGMPLDRPAILIEYLNFSFSRDIEMKVVQFLLEQGANVNAKISYHSTHYDELGRGPSPLHFATLHGAPSKLIPLLVEFGAELEQRDRQGNTPLQRAIRLGNMPAIRQLHDAGACIQVIEWDSMSSWKRDLFKALYDSSTPAIELAKFHGLKVQRLAHTHILLYPKCRESDCEGWRKMCLKANAALFTAHETALREAVNWAKLQQMS